MTSTISNDNSTSEYEATVNLLNKIPSIVHESTKDVKKSCDSVAKPQLKELNAQEQKEYMQRIKSGEVPFLLSNIWLRMSSFVTCQKNGEEIILETKLGRHVIFEHDRFSVARMFDYISKLLEAIEFEDYESMRTLQKWIKTANNKKQYIQYYN